MDHPTDRDEALVSFHKKRGELIEANKHAAPSARAFLQRQSAELRSQSLGTRGEDKICSSRSIFNQFMHEYWTKVQCTDG